MCLTRHLSSDVPAGSVVLIDDGEIELKVVKRDGDFLECLIENDGILGSRKSVNIPGVKICLPSLTDKDRIFIKMAAENEVDFIAHSFVRSKQDVLDVQAVLDEYNSNIKIIAKIENQEGVDNIDDILDDVYGIMVARGDLGIEIPYEKIPGIQKMIISKCITQQETCYCGNPDASFNDNQSKADKGRGKRYCKCNLFTDRCNNAERRNCKWEISG